MSLETNADHHSTELPIITGKELSRTTYRVLAQLVAVGLAALLFQSDLNHLPGGYRDVAILIASALILIANNRYLMRMASRRTHFTEQAALIVEDHLRLDEAMGAQLKEVVGDTENAAMILIMEVEKLNHAANTLASYLDNAPMKIDGMAHDIGESVDFIVKIGNFVHTLPERLQQELETIREVRKEIAELVKDVAVISELSRQADVLAINASTVAAHAGQFGNAFAIVVAEMHKLSLRSDKLAVMIERAQHTLQSGLKFNFIEESAQQMSGAAKAVESISRLQESHEDMRQYYKTLFSMVTAHNTSVTADIGEILGQVQFQDVVRQRIERIEDAVAKRNQLFQGFAQRINASDADLLELHVQMRKMLDEYLLIESCHAPSNNASRQAESLPKFELF
ncbi:MAG: methyl-accepting chemotaxis protein [Methylobacter sp.]